MVGGAGVRVDAVVVGSGPNGLTAAVVLARAGLRVLVLEGQPTIGGGARTLDLGLRSGVKHDVCSAVHPLAAVSPVFRQFDLTARGVKFVTPDASFAHPLADEASVLAYRSLERTARELGADGPAWRALFGPLTSPAEAIDALSAATLGDKRSIPAPLRNPGGLATAARFGARTLIHGTHAWNLSLRTPRARALVAGAASHAIVPLPSLAAAGTALMLTALGHAGGWPIPVGGSQAITDALLADLLAHGGEVRASSPVRSLADLPPARTILFDTSADGAARILDGRSPRARRAAALPHTAGAAKVDFVVNAPIPWQDPRTALAGTVHLGGTRGQIQAAEAAVTAGRMPRSPVVLVNDPAQFDPSRISPGGERPVWTYAHVPLNSRVDPTVAVTKQIERFAPGFRSTVIASRGVPASAMQTHNASLTGGDIAGGHVSWWRLLARPTMIPDPFDLGEADGRRVFLCSAATPPGPGVHGMNGYFAATRALRKVWGRRAPSMAPGPPVD